jgi:hypothetical protein
MPPQRLPRMSRHHPLMGACDGVRPPSDNHPGRPLAALPMRIPDEHASLTGGRPRWVATAQPMSTGDGRPAVSAHDGSVPPR